MSSLFQETVFKRTYARLRRSGAEANGEKEEWSETVKRYCDYIFRRLGAECQNDILSDVDKNDIYEAILNKDVMPSMRLLLTAGDAHRENHISGYNCCFVALTEPCIFSEVLYILMAGCGVGFSVERKHINQLPLIPNEIIKVDTTIFVIEDSKLGWAEAFKYHIKNLYEGFIINFDYSKIRAKGAQLKTFGGYASGHEVFKELIDFTTGIFLQSVGLRLRPIECHSILCKIGSIVVVAGTRRSAMISFSDLDDDEMATAKSGDWYINNIHFSLANNSAVYYEKPSMEVYLKEMYNIYKSYSGERGFYNIAGVKKHLPKRRKDLNFEGEFYSNPCSELGLRETGQFCNLTEVVIKPYDSHIRLLQKIRIATILGTIQSTFTDFKFLRPIYKKNCDEERLLGVSLTGICDNFLTRHPNPLFLEQMKEHSIEVNKIYASKLNINQSSCATCVKPSGTVSALCGTSSGIHNSFSNYYIRRIRISKTDPLCDTLIRNQIPNEVDFYSPESIVFSFPLTNPNHKEMSALEQFNLYILYTKHFTEHKVSITINYKPDEYLELLNEMYYEWDNMLGVALLPKNESTYKQMPFEAITKQEYEKFLNNFPTSIDWTTNTKNDIHYDDKIAYSLQCLGTSCDL